MRGGRCPQGCDRTPKEDASHPWADIWILLGGWLYFAEWQSGQRGARLAEAAGNPPQEMRWKSALQGAGESCPWRRVPRQSPLGNRRVGPWEKLLTAHTTLPGLKPKEHVQGAPRCPPTRKEPPSSRTVSPVPSAL